MFDKTTSRRNFLKKMAAASAMATAASIFPGILFANDGQGGLDDNGNVTWKKAPCRFCGVGCGVVVNDGVGCGDDFDKFFCFCNIFIMFFNGF